jgi:hypothetical protein
MWVQEIEFDMSQDPPLCLSEGGIQNVEDITIAELRVAAEQEFGQYVEDLTDPDNEDAPIGWKFRTQASYEDPENGGEFDLETWIVLHDSPPEMKFRYHVILDSEMEVLNHIDAMIDKTPSADITGLALDPTVSVQEVLSSLGGPPTGNEEPDAE